MMDNCQLDRLQYSGSGRRLLGDCVDFVEVGSPSDCGWCLSWLSLRIVLSGESEPSTGKPDSIFPDWTSCFSQASADLPSHYSGLHFELRAKLNALVCKVLLSGCVIIVTRKERDAVSVASSRRTLKLLLDLWHGW